MSTPKRKINRKRPILENIPELLTKEEVEQLIDLIHFSIGVRLNVKAKMIFRKHVVKKYSFSEIETAIRKCGRTSNPEIAVHMIQKALKEEREFVENRVRFNELLGNALRKVKQNG